MALPKHVQRGITFHGAECQCIVVSSNIPTKQLQRAQDINLIKKFQDVLQVDAQQTSLVRKLHRMMVSNSLKDFGGFY